RSNGLRLETPAGEMVVRSQATDDPTQVANADVILIGVKAWQVPEAARAIRPMIAHSFVVPLQNGVEAPSQLAAALGVEHVLCGLCGTLSWVTGPGRIRSAGGHNFIKFAEMDNRRSEWVEGLCRAFVNARVPVKWPSVIIKTLWAKFLLVTPLGGFCAIPSAP